MKKLFFFLLILFIIPLLVGNFYKKESKRSFKIFKNEIIRVKHDDTGQIEEVPLESYVKGVVAGEMPVSFELEALKAQAVASRSYVLKRVEYNKDREYDIVDTQQNQVYLTEDELKNAWKEKYDEYMKKINTAVYGTIGEYIEYDGEIAEAFFFSTSTGMTENSGEIFSSQLPYLVSVDSSWDGDVSPVYSTYTKFSLDEFYRLLEIPYSNTLEIKKIKTTSTGRNRELEINGYQFNYMDILNKLDLRSSYFEIEQNGDEVIINVKGFGHGVGMSQYGAEAMANRGYNYEEILKYYYRGVNINKI